jgi:hypothetical protein
MLLVRLVDRRGRAQPQTPSSTMESGVQPPKPRPRRSYSALPKIGTSNNTGILSNISNGASDHKKGHLGRHSLHHHLPHPHRRQGKEAHAAASSPLVGSDISKQNTRSGEYSASSGESRPQSLKASDGAREDAWVHSLVKVRPEDVCKERQRRTARDKYDDKQVYKRRQNANR